jgi:outer membrane biosynthesis protein TonB
VTTGARVATEDDEQKEMRIDRITKLSSTNEIPKNESSKPNIDKNVSVAKVGAVDKDNSASSTGGLNPNHKSASGGLAAEPDSPTKTLSSGVLNGKALRLDKPKYPATASAVRVSGQVAVQVLIDEQGNIYSAKAVTGHPLLRRNSEIAACESKFLPTLLSGQPVKVSGIVIYNYVP